MNVSTQAAAALGADRARYALMPLDAADVARWDELIAPYDSRGLFHRRVWLDYLAASRRIEVRFWAIREGTRTVGYFCGGILRRGPFRVLGSPLKSWGTNFMGPLLEPGVDQTALMRALGDLARREGLAMIELEHPDLSVPALAAAGYEPVTDYTYLVTLTPDTDAMWRSLHSTCRNRIRHAERAGLTVEDTDDPAVVEQYFDQYVALMRRKGVASPFPRAYARKLFTVLRKADSIFALRVRDRDGNVLAVGLFPHDDCAMYFWGGSSVPDGHPLCPNDFLHWQAMTLGARRGLKIYNMSGYGRFKRKFGGELMTVRRWHRSYWPLARWARKGYQHWFQTSVRVRGQLRRAAYRLRGGDPVATRAPWPLHTERAAFRLSDIWKAPLHDYPVRDEILFQYLPVTREMDALEIGPGSGITAFRMARYLRSLTLLDIAAGNLNNLKKALSGAPNIGFVCADICKPDVQAELGRQFDAIYAIEVFELLPDAEAALKNMSGLLRPGGRLLLQFPNYPPERSPGLTHFRTREEFDRLMRDAKFTTWEIYNVRLRPHARALYGYLHERPLRLYRRLRSNTSERPLIYDESWAHQHAHRLQRYRAVLNTAWIAMALAMRTRGDVFEHTLLGQDIFNQNLLVLARR